MGKNIISCQDLLWQSWRRRVGIDTLLTYKEFRLFWDFWAACVDQTCTTRWSSGRVQVWVQVRAHTSHLAITSWGRSTMNSKVLTAKSMAQLLGLSSGTAWACQTGEQQHRAFPSLQQPRQTRLRETCYYSCNTYYLLSSTVKVFNGV